MLELKILKIMAILLGLTLALFGYFIFFRKKYSLINRFDEDFKAGRKNEEYARRAGLIEFVLGIILLISGIALIIFA